MSSSFDFSAAFLVLGLNDDLDLSFLSGVNNLISVHFSCLLISRRFPVYKSSQLKFSKLCYEPCCIQTVPLLYPIKKIVILICHTGCPGNIVHVGLQYPLGGFFGVLVPFRVDGISVLAAYRRLFNSHL